MTVKELINQLATVDQNAIVRIHTTADCGYINISYKVVEVIASPERNAVILNAPEDWYDDEDE